MRQGGTLRIEGSFGAQNGSVLAGSGASGNAGSPPGSVGKAWGTGLFLQGSGDITFAPAQGKTQTVADVMADERGVAGSGGSYSLTMAGLGTLVLSGDNRYSGDTRLLSGVLQADAAGPASATGNSRVTAVGGRLTGQGNMAGPVIVEAGSVAPGNTTAPYASLGVGSFVQGGGGTLVIAANATSNSQLRVSGGATLSGTLRVDFSSMPTAGQSFTVLSAGGGVTGTFSSLQVSGLPEGPALNAFYDSNSVKVATYTLTYPISTAVTPAGSGAITCTANPVLYDQGSECTVMPADGFVFDSFSGDCSGAICILSNVQSARTVNARFLPVRSFSGTTVPTIPAQAGTATASFTGGGETCHFDGADTAFVAAPAAKPAGHTLPQGMFHFRLADCDTSPVTMTVEWPGAVSSYIKYGRADAADTEDRYFAPEGLSINGHNVSFTVQDGQKGDDDWSENGIITDPTGPTEVRPPMAVPALGSWGVFWLSVVAAGLGARRRRR